MKKLLAIILIGLVANTAIAENWAYLNEDDTQEMYIGTETKSTKVVDGNTVIGVWLKMVEKEPLKTKPYEGNYVYATKGKFWFDCVNETMSAQPTEMKFLGKDDSLIYETDYFPLDSVKFKDINFQEGDESDSLTYNVVCNSD